MEPHSASQERRLVTVLFADVTGSTALAEALDAEDVSALLERFFRIARESVESHGGTVEKFIGDAVVAVFGLPIAHGDDADRAAAAAIEIRDRVRTDAVLGDRLPIRLGLNTGEVVATRAVAGDDASLGADGRFTGDSVNVAARLQQGAGVWGIVAGERTARAATGFSFGPFRDIETKGKSAPVRACELLGPRTEQARRLPIVGRDADLAQLELVARRAFKEGRPYLISLVAPAGTGKTRLVEAFLDLLPEIAPSADTAIAQCLPYGQRMTYWPLRQMLHRLSGIDVDAPPDAARRDLVGWLTELGASNPLQTADAIAATIGIADAETVDSTGLVVAWRSVVELAAARRPLVLVFEDLHWSSDSLLDLVEFVMQPRGDLPLVMIALTRPELLERRPTWGGGRRNHLSLVLEPLDNDAVATLVQNLLEAAPPSLIDAVVRRAEGNPFYATEIVRSITERLGSDGIAGSDQSALIGTLPDTVQATVLSRLDGLPSQARHVLQVGAVFGRSFASSAVGAVEPGLTADVDSALDVLLDRDLVRASGGEDYTFRHILIREVAYQTLTRAERARFHAAAGEWLEAHSGANVDAYAELIAFHSREAATLSSVLGAPAGVDLAARAENWLGRAATAAVTAGALLEAQHHLTAALEFAPHERFPDLLVRIADSSSTGTSAIPALQQAIALSATQDRTAAWRLSVIAKLLTWETRFSGAVPEAIRLSPGEIDGLLDAGRELMGATDDALARARFLVAELFLPFAEEALGLSFGPDIAEQAVSWGREGLAIAQEVGDDQLVSTAYDALTSVAQQLGHYREALDLSERRLTAVERMDLQELIDASCMLAWNGAVLGELDSVDNHAARVLAGLQPGQVPSWALHLTSWRIYIVALKGEWTELMSLADRAVQLWHELDRAPAGYAGLALGTALEVARARRDERRVDATTDMYDVIAAAFSTSARRQLFNEVRADRASASGDVAIAAAKKAPAYAERWLQFASDRGASVDAVSLETLLDIAERYGAEPLAVATLRAKGLLNGDPELLRDARARASAISMVPTVARLDCEIGRLSGDRTQVESGRRLLRDIGDLVALDRYE